MNDLENELQKALKYIDANWIMQNNNYDFKSAFIYKTNTVEEVINLSKINNVDYKYCLHRWYNFHTSIQCENIFIEYGAIKEKNYRNKEIDIYINNIPFDVKLTVYPKALSNHPYDLNKKEDKNKLIEWMYLHQSQEQRKHLKNRLFIVCDGNTQYDSLCLKSDFNQIRKKIFNYINEVNKNGFNEITITDNGNKYVVKSDIIYINNKE